MTVRTTPHPPTPSGPAVHEHLMVDGRPASPSPAASPTAPAAIPGQPDDSMAVRHIDIERETS